VRRGSKFPESLTQNSYYHIFGTAPLDNVSRNRKPNPRGLSPNGESANKLNPREFIRSSETATLEPHKTWLLPPESETAYCCCFHRIQHKYLPPSQELQLLEMKQCKVLLTEDQACFYGQSYHSEQISGASVGKTWSVPDTFNSNSQFLNCQSLLLRLIQVVGLACLVCCSIAAA